MFEILTRLLSDLIARTPAATFAGDDPRLAVAVLLCHVAAVDGDTQPEERRQVVEELTRRYDLPDEIAHDLTEAATRIERETVALADFTAGLQRRLPIDERREIVAALCKVALAEGGVHEFEDAVVWRIADLLGIPPHERVAIAKTAEADVAEARSRAGTGEAS